MYEPTYGRFMSVDPLWMKYLPYSPYIYCRNNPVSRIDDSGLGDEPIETEKVVTRLVVSEDVWYNSHLLSEPTPRYVGGKVNGNAYNCHSYAWSNGRGDEKDSKNDAVNFPLWDNDPTNNMEAATRLSFDEQNAFGDIVVYFGINTETGEVEATHSAVVTEVDASGKTTKVASTWGAAGVYEHHPRDVPGIYSVDAPVAADPSGKPYETRVYYRPKEK